MARAKKKAVEPAEKRDHLVVAKAVPLFGVIFLDQQMRAVTAFGRTPEEMGQAARNAIQRHLPKDRWNIDIEYVNAEAFEKLGVSLEPDA